LGPNEEPIQHKPVGPNVRYDFFRKRCVCDVLSEVAVREGILQLLIGKKREEELILKNFLLEMGRGN
jgi:hypothetical protein